MTRQAKDSSRPSRRFANASRGNWRRSSAAMTRLGPRSLENPSRPLPQVILRRVPLHLPKCLRDDRIKTREGKAEAEAAIVGIMPATTTRTAGKPMLLELESFTIPISPPNLATAAKRGAAARPHHSRPGQLLRARKIRSSGHRKVQTEVGEEVLDSPDEAPKKVDLHSTLAMLSTIHRRPCRPAGRRAQSRLAWPCRHH